MRIFRLAPLRTRFLPLCVVLFVAPAAAEPTVIEDVLGILRQRGILDEAQYSRLQAKNETYEERQRTVLQRIALSGDLRARHESFWYDADPTGSEAPDRHRIRYRLRLQGRAEVNDWITAAFQLSTGDSHRSADQTLGAGVGGDPAEFDPDGIFLRRAYLRAALPTAGFSSRLLFGKMPNPFRWGIGKDYLWDSDIAPEGVALQISGQPWENLGAFFHTGYFVIDEESRGKDPHLFGAQLGGELAIDDTLALGGRASFYAFRSIDEEFVDRQAELGNIAAGFQGGSDNRLKVVESTLYAKLARFENWPILVYGSYVENLDAESAGGAAPENRAFGLGLELGDPAAVAELGLAYWRMEANAFPANLTDSVLFDGFTNREGLALYAAKRILPRTDLKLELFMGDEIEDDAVYFDDLDAGDFGRFDRVRLRTDLVVTF